MPLGNFIVTIVTACWNPDGVKEAIKTVDNQTYLGWQHILVNDNNPEVRELFKSLPASNNRFCVDLGVRTHYYGGIARDIGAMTAFSYFPEKDRNVGSEFVLFLDDDNTWEPDHLSSMVAVKLENPEATLIASDAIWVGAKDKKWRVYKKCELRHGGCDLGQFMYNTELFRKYGFFNPRPRRKHKFDWELINKIVEGEGQFKIAYTNRPTFIMNYKRK